MKNWIKIVLGVTVIIALVVMVNRLMNNKGKSDTELIEFAIEDIETVDKIIITDAFGRSFEIIKKEDAWTDKDGNCIIQESVEFILDAFKNIEFKGYLNDSSHANFTHLTAAKHTKVEIFQNDEWTKTWYIGPPFSDHYGQIMLLDSEKYGKSTHPVIMKIKGVHGIVEPRFFADPKKWECTNIFALEPDEIKLIDVEFFDEPERSFKVEKSGTNMKVYQQNKLLSGVDTAMLFRYINNYQKIHFDVPNYELNFTQVDSLKKTTPFAELTVKEVRGNSTKLKMYRIVAKDATIDDGVVRLEDKDRDRFWCELPSGEIVKCQYYVFNPLLLGHIYFPMMDLSNVKTHDGMLAK